MSQLGAMSESECQHVRARVRAAMDAQVVNEGRHQGGLRTAELAHAPDGTVLLEGDTFAVAIDPDAGTVRVDHAVRGDNDAMPSPGAWVTVDEREVVGHF